MNSTKNHDMKEGINQNMKESMDQDMGNKMKKNQKITDENLSGNLNENLNTTEVTPEAEAEEEEQKKVFPLIWLIVLFLFIAVLLTAILVVSYIKEQASRDKNVIHLVPEDAVLEEIDGNDGSQGGNEADGNNGDGSDSASSESSGAGQNGGADRETTGTESGGAGSETEGESAESKPIPVLPGFEGSDLVGLWRNQTTVNIFRDFYNEKTGIWTVWSSDGDKVIAPGTGKDYDFQLKNTGNISMDYVLTIESTFDMGDVRVPIEVRLKTADGIYIAGDENTWIYPEELNEVVETGTLDVNHYANYVLQWRWPFEPEYATEGWNINDTTVGNKAVYEDLNFTMTIRTTATTTPGAKPVAGYWLNGTYIPKTGDNTNAAPYMAGLTVAGVGLFMLIFARRRRGNKEKETVYNEMQP